MSDAFGLPGGPAFPISIPGVGDNGGGGMSLRDYFAGQALTHFVHSYHSENRRRDCRALL
jgi:hypothetical protein